jgi:hypothetical protein
LISYVANFLAWTSLADIAKAKIKGKNYKSLKIAFENVPFCHRK